MFRIALAANGRLTAAMLDLDLPVPSATHTRREPCGRHEDRVENTVLKLEAKYADKIRIDPRLTRKAVSFQANKSIPVLRWYKYKEGFSAELVSRYLSELDFPRAKILDPFAGSGTTLALSADAGFACEGIELLPIGQLITEARLQLARKNVPSVARQLRHWVANAPWKLRENYEPIPTLKITACAYPAQTEQEFGSYLGALESERGPAKTLLALALMSVLNRSAIPEKMANILGGIIDPGEML